MATTSDLPQRGFFFWAIAPFLVLLFVMNLAFARPTSQGGMIALVGIQILLALVFLGLFNGNRFRWAWRGAGALVFVTYACYVALMLIESGGRVTITPRRSEASAFNAICGLIAFGLPGLWFAIFGRFTLRREAAMEGFEADDAFE